MSLAYDPLGRLQSSTASGTTTNFLYDGDALIAEYDNAGNILRRYVPGPGQDEPVVWYEGAGTSGRRWLHADDLGSIIAWSDASGNPQAVYGYGPYGEPGAWSGSRYSYTGQLMIPEAHLYNYKARAYDPGLGRFLQSDPAGYASDINAYAYARNDSINRIDFSGLEFSCVGSLQDDGSGVMCYNSGVMFWDVESGTFKNQDVGGGDVERLPQRFQNCWLQQEGRLNQQTKLRVFQVSSKMFCATLRLPQVAAALMPTRERVEV